VPVPFCAANTTFDPVSRFRQAAATRRSGLATDRNPQRLVAENDRQRNLRTPRFDVDQLKRVSALANIRADPLAIAAVSIGPRQMESTGSKRDLIASTSSGTTTNCVRTAPNTEEEYNWD
jgi:hypothetical protein